MIELLFLLLWLPFIILAVVVYNDAADNPNATRSPTFWFVVVAFFPVFGLLMYLIEAWEKGGMSSQNNGAGMVQNGSANQKPVTVSVAGEVEKPNGERTEVEMKVNTNGVYQATTKFRDSCVNKGYEPVGRPRITIDSVGE